MKIKKQILMFVFIYCSLSLFASNITFTYDNKNVTISTKLVANETTKQAFLEGFYDAYMVAKEHYCLWEIYEMIQNKSFSEYGFNNSLCKSTYLESIKDFMKTSTQGSNGSFEFVYPIYENLMSLPTSFDVAEKIVYYGKSVFFLISD